MTMTETCMKPEIVNGIKTTAQIKYENKINRYNTNRDRKAEKAMRKLNKNINNSQSKNKRWVNYVDAEIRNSFFIYVFKIINSRTKRIDYKVGKADKPLKRIGEWVTGINKKLGKDIEVKYIWSKECKYHKDNYIYYMTKYKNLSGDDADYIFRCILETYFSVKTYTITTDDGTTVTKECCDFGTINDDEVKNICNGAYSKWIDLIEETPDVKICDNFVRYSHVDVKEDKVEFTHKNIRYDYQEACFNWIFKNALEGKGEDFYIRIPCGGGKSSISMCGLVQISELNDYRPILLLSGLNSVSGAFESDSDKFTYHGITVKVYNIDDFNLSIYEENRDEKIVSLVYTTCQSSVKTQKEENYDVVDEVSFSNNEAQILSYKLMMLLDSGIRFSCGITDEAHKIVFGKKMREIFPLIRNYHSGMNLNFFHMSGTGFSINNKFLVNKKYEIDICDVLKEQGDTAVRRHMIVCENNNFLPYFYSNIKNGWDMLLDEECHIVSGFEDVDSIHCISTIRYGYVKPVIGAYLRSKKDVRKSFDYLNGKYSFDDVLIISANGGESKGDKFIRNDVGGKICEIKNAHSEITTQIRKAVAENKMVILLNVNKFVESWTIKEMNVQLILRNINSPDTFGQSICRSTRTYTHEKHVIKKDAFVFLYGDTFVTMAYKYDNIIRQNSDKNITEPFSFMSELDAVYIGGKKYSYQERNLIDLRKRIDKRMMQLNISADSFINNVLAGKFPYALDKMMKMTNVFFNNTTRCANSKFDVVNGDKQNDDKSKHEHGDSITKTAQVNEKSKNKDDVEVNKQLKQLKTFLSKLQLEAIMNCHCNEFDYDKLVNGLKCHITNGNDKITEYENEISKFLGDEYVSFKKHIENWLEEQYCIN
jgi:hypothetical protein